MPSRVAWVFCAAWYACAISVAGNPAARDAHGTAELPFRSAQSTPYQGCRKKRMRINAGRKGASSSAATVALDRNVLNSRSLARSCVLLSPRLVASTIVLSSTMGARHCSKSDCEATEQPAAQGVERSAENKSDYGDDREADKGFDAAAADHPIEHFNGIEGQDQKQHVDRHAKGDDPHQRGSSRNQSKQRSLTRRWDFTTVTRIHEQPALSLTEYCRRQERGGCRAAPP